MASSLGRWRGYNYGTMLLPKILGGTLRRDEILLYADSDPCFDEIALALGIYDPEGEDDEEGGEALCSSRSCLDWDY